MKSVPVYDMKGKTKGKFSLDETFFDGRINRALLHQTTLIYLKNLRKGNACTKRRDEVSGGGRKPWRQKGTGRARTGSIRNPIWRGGGIIFGPKPRRFTVRLPKNVRTLALTQALNGKIKDNELVVVEKISLTESKTKELASFLGALKANAKPLVVIEKRDLKISRAGQNISGVTIKPFNYINAYDVLKHKKVIFSRQALENLIKLRKK